MPWSKDNGFITHFPAPKKNKIHLITNSNVLWGNNFSRKMLKKTFTIDHGLFLFRLQQSSNEIPDILTA